MDINKLDFNLIKALDALLTNANVSTAAQHLNLSQPAVSASLARLRSILNDPLLVRRGNVMQRTARADELQPIVAAMVDDISHVFLKPDSFEPGSSSRHFRILVNDYAAHVILPNLTADLRHKAPGIVMEILPFDRRYEDIFATREADMAVSDSYSLGGYRHSQILYSERFISVVRADHPRLGKGDVSLEAFISEEHALVSMKGRVSGVIDKALSKLGKSRDVVLTLPYFIAAPAVIEKTDLVITVPAYIALNYAKNHAVRLFDPPVKAVPFDVTFAWSPRSVADPAMQWIKEQLIMQTNQLCETALK